MNEMTLGQGFFPSSIGFLLLIIIPLLLHIHLLSLPKVYVRAGQAPNYHVPGLQV
jgi:hypothetical protein